MKINLDSQENLEIICERCVIVLGWVPDSNNVIVGVKYNEEETSIERHPPSNLFENATSRTATFMTFRER